MRNLIFACALLAGMNPVVTARADENAFSQPLSFTLEDGRILAEGAFVADTAEQFEAFLAANGKLDGNWNIPLYIQSPVARCRPHSTWAAACAAMGCRLSPSMSAPRLAPT
jgi:hypothetical protein